MGLEVEHYDSLAQMVRQSNVAVVGTVTSARFTRTFVDSDGQETMVDRMLEVRVSVERVLHGHVVDGADELGVEFGPFDDGNAIADLRKPLIGRRAVFVLRRLGAPVGLDPRRPDQLAWKVYRVVCSQGLLDDADGVTAVPMADILVPFVKALRGKPFDDVVGAVDAAG